MSDERWQGFSSGLLFAAGTWKAETGHDITAVFFLILALWILCGDRVIAWIGEPK